MAVDTKSKGSNGTSIAANAEQTTTSLLNNVAEKSREVFDAIFPPEKRAQWWNSLTAFATNHPKLAAFLLTNIVLSGGPLLLFAVFTLTVFVVSLLGALIIALIAALLFTVFMLLVALFIVLPTIFLTTMAASFIFIWGLGGYYLLQWFNEDKSPAEVGKTVGDGLNSLTGGRLTSVMNTIRGPAVEGSPDVQGKLGATEEKDSHDDKSKGDVKGNGISNTPISKSAKKGTPAKLPVSTPAKQDTT